MVKTPSFHWKKGMWVQFLLRELSSTCCTTQPKYFLNKLNKLFFFFKKEESNHLQKQNKNKPRSIAKPLWRWMKYSGHKVHIANQNFGCESVHPSFNYPNKDKISILSSPQMSTSLLQDEKEKIKVKDKSHQRWDRLATMTACSVLWFKYYTLFRCCQPVYK